MLCQEVHIIFAQWICVFDSIQESRKIKQLSIENEWFGREFLSYDHIPHQYKILECDKWRFEFEMVWEILHCKEMWNFNNSFISHHFPCFYCFNFIDTSIRAIIIWPSNFYNHIPSSIAMPIILLSTDHHPSFYFHPVFQLSIIIPCYEFLLWLTCIIRHHLDFLIANGAKKYHSKH